MDNRLEKEKTFRVTVGVAECTVTCGSERGAVEETRSQFRQQMPHMGTAIQGISDREFQVDRVR
ncbi:MAG: hypothetical protein NTW96_23575 [Planctomycetia bacterium]|nr:hypothetical protein [Planctomycetia bacterium]